MVLNAAKKRNLFDGFDSNPGNLNRNPEDNQLQMDNFYEEEKEGEKEESEIDIDLQKYKNCKLEYSRNQTSAVTKLTDFSIFAVISTTMTSKVFLAENTHKTSLYAIKMSQKP